MIALTAREVLVKLHTINASHITAFTAVPNTLPHIRKAIIDKNARIGDGVRIVNQKGLDSYDGKDFFIRDGIVIIPKNSLISSGTVI